MFRRHHDGPLPFVRHRPTTNPILPVENLDGAADFYRRLGFEVQCYDDGYAWVTHCGWEWFHLRRVDSVAGNQASAYLHVDDADAWHQAMTTVAAGSIDLDAPADMPWGKREFSVTDPAGNVVRLGSST